ncbi:MAG TPA: DUF1223 domain-containing protein, partial [Thermoanaerobaculia bacterium]|nr:DUF1223 domain-containing protein [Thermoanaerobaculia bacterium]
MSGRILVVVMLGVICAALLASAAMLRPPVEPSGEWPTLPAGSAEGGAVLVELFTSQGCSSCPPADELLRRLAAEPALAGRVVPLAFHVDYWDWIGWRDPFSDERWSDRQRRYAHALGAESVYTPMLVIAGRQHVVGSNRGKVGVALREALEHPAVASVEVRTAPPEGGGLPVTVTAVRRATAGDRPLELWIALWQDGLVTPVDRGENADRELRNDRVVRRLVSAGTLAPASGAR